MGFKRQDCLSWYIRHILYILVYFNVFVCSLLLVHVLILARCVWG